MKVEILENKKIAWKYFKLSFRPPGIAEDARPGQFIQIRVSDGLEPLLRKPLGIHRVKKSGIVEVLYEVIGKGTEILSSRRPGEYLDVIGPLGNGFEYSSPVRQFASSPVLAAGGIGVAPLVFLAEKLINRKTEKLKNGKTMVLLGGKTKCDILCEREFKDLGCEVMIATDDGSKGHKGFVTDLLKDVLRRTRDEGRGMIYACGPRPMLKEAAAIAARYKVPCQVLLEEYIACGVGVCLGCPVKVSRLNSKLANPQTRKPADYIYKMVCKDGPVFNGNEVIWG